MTLIDDVQTCDTLWVVPLASGYNLPTQNAGGFPSYLNKEERQQFDFMNSGTSYHKIYKNWQVAICTVYTPIVRWISCRLAIDTVSIWKDLDDSRERFSKVVAGGDGGGDIVYVHL